MSTSDSGIEPIELMADEFAERQRRGERPTIEEYVQRFPEMAAEIREVFPALAVIEQVAPDSRDLSITGVALDEHLQRGQLGDYRILREIGRGGMGVVYEAEQESLGRRVALKVLPRDFTLAAGRLERFEREARAAARMHHTNIVPVFDVGHEDGTAYYAMQLIRGQGLDLVIKDLRKMRSLNTNSQSGASPGCADSVKAEPSGLAHSLVAGRFTAENLHEASDGAVSLPDPAELPPTKTITQESESGSSAVLPGQSDISTAHTNRRAYFQSVAEIGIQTARALGYAHARGIIHRDIKPSNLLLDSAGVIWVTDFGLAKTGDDGLTHTGDVLGTLRYMAPERFRGQCDQRADIYSLGLTLYELLVLRPAFASSDRAKTIEQVCHAEPIAPRSVDSLIPVDLETIVLKSFDKDPRRRYPTADDLVEDLHRFVHDQPIKARPISSAERLARWSRRNKSIAASLLAVATLFVVLLVGSVLAASYYYRQQEVQRKLAAEKASEAERALEAQEEATRAQTAAELAQRDAESAAEQRRRLLYASNMQLVDQLWRNPDGTARQLEELLAAWIPVDDKPDLRDFAWRHQWSRLHSAASITVVGATAATVSPGGNLVVADANGIREWSESGQVISHPWKRDATDAILSGNGRWAVVRASESQLQIVDLASGEVIRIVEGTHAVFSPNDTFIGVWGDTAPIKVSDVTTGEQIAEFNWAVGRASPDSFEVALAPDGKSLLIGRHPEPKVVSLHSVNSIEPKVFSHLGVVRVCTWSPDGRFFACGDGPGIVYVRSTTDPPFFAQFAPGGWSIDALAFSPDSRQIAVGKLDGNVDVWDITLWLASDSTTAPSVPQIGTPIERAAMIMAAHLGGDVSVQGQGTTPRLVRSLKGHVGIVTSAHFSNEGQLLATTDRAGVARLWRLDHLDDSITMHAAADELGDVGLDVSKTNDGFRVVGLGETALTEGNVRIGDLVTAMENAEGIGLPVAGMSLWEFQSRMLGPAGSTLRLNIDSSGKEKTVELRRGLKSDSGLWGVAFSPDSTALAAAGLGGTFLWELGKNEPPLRLFGQGQAVAFSPDGRFLAFSHIETVQIWDRQSSELHATWPVGHQVSCLTFSPRGDYLAVGTGHSTLNEGQSISPVKVWDMEQQHEILARLDPFDRPVPDLKFSPDGRLLIATDFDGRIRLWDTQSWSEKLRLRGDDAWSLAISPDSQQMAVGGGYDASGVTLWDIDSGTKTRVLGGHVQPVCGLAYSPDGKTLASASADRTVVLWDLSTGMPLRTLRGHSGWIHGVAFAADGQTLATASFDGTVRLWHATNLGRIERDPQTLRAMLRLGASLNKHRRFVQGEATLTRALELQEVVLPDDDLDLAATRAELGQALLGQTKNDSAIKVLTDGLAKARTNITLLETRAQAYLSIRDYRHAAEDQLKLGSGDWYGCYHAAVLFLMADDVEGYQRACRAIERFAAPGPAQHEVIIKTLLVSHHSPQGRDFPYVVDYQNRYDGSNAEGMHQWNSIAGLLAAYRKGDYTEATSWIEYINQLRANDLVIDKALVNVLVLEGMVAFQLGHIESAKQKLAEAKVLIDRLMQYPPEGPDIVLLRDVFQAEILRREAVALINVDSTERFQPSGD